MGYGTGAIMAVPGHDERDWAFARAMNLPIREVVAGETSTQEAYVDLERGAAVNSTTPDGTFSIDGLKANEAIDKIIAWLEARAIGRRAVNYKLRDWLFARQRYWGEPFPIVWAGRAVRSRCPSRCFRSVLPETREVQALRQRRRPAREPDRLGRPRWDPDGKPAQRETNTMPQWAGSCWYYLRFLDPQQRRAAGRSGAREVLDAGRPLRRRRRARGAAPALRALLAQGALRHRRGQHARAVHDA